MDLGRGYLGFGEGWGAGEIHWAEMCASGL